MAKIHSAYGDRPESRVNCAGNRWEPHYIEQYDELGRPYLVQDGETDVYAEIQSYKDSCDIHVLLERYANGDPSVMSRQGQYVDISGMPQTWHEIFNTLQRQREAFDQLPINTKNAFNNSFEQWAATAGNNDWMDKMGYKQEKKEEVKGE